jgi:hypothetical protein
VSRLVVRILFDLADSYSIVSGHGLGLFFGSSEKIVGGFGLGQLTK